MLARIQGWRRPALGVGLPLTIGLVHVALIAPHYFVGSFDDDAGYILTARALLDGQGLTGHVTSGMSVIGLYPPGYSALLAPLVWIWPHTFVPLRLLSVVCYAAVFGLTWMYMGQRRIGEGYRFATLTLLALGPPLATFGSMVMAEAPFLVLLLVLLIVVDRWDQQSRLITPAGAGVVLCAAGLVWLKEAGLGVVVGLMLWLAVRPDPRGRLRRSVAVGTGIIVLLLPVVVARLTSGIPLAGARYSEELGTYYTGSLADRVLHVAPSSIQELLWTAVPRTIIPYRDPLPITGVWPKVWIVLSWQVTVLAAIGAVVWWRKYRDSAVAIVPIYLLETIFWPYVNERRSILVVPLLAIWYVLGAGFLWQIGRSRIRAGISIFTYRAAGAMVGTAVVVVPLIFQLPRDYLFGLRQNSSEFQGSPYTQLLSRLGTPAAVVETDYQSATALFTGHRTMWTAFESTITDCSVSTVVRSIARDHAAFLLVGDFNKPGLLDSPCLLGVAAESPWAVKLLTGSRDNATVFELIGPGTGNPNLTDLTREVTPSVSASNATVTTEWQWTSPRTVTQVSLGAAAVGSGDTTGVSVQLRGQNGAWRVVASSGRPVGVEPGDPPYLLTTLGHGITATALRVIVNGSEAPSGVHLGDVTAIGPVDIASSLP